MDVTERFFAGMTVAGFLVLVVSVAALMVS
jgi:hypothetical protein